MLAAQSLPDPDQGHSKFIRSLELFTSIGAQGLLPIGLEKNGKTGGRDLDFVKLMRFPWNPELKIPAH